MEDNESVDPDILGIVLEAREEIEDASTSQELAYIRAENETRYKATLKNLSDAFRRDDFQDAKRHTIRLKYWDKINQAIDEK